MQKFFKQAILFCKFLLKNITFSKNGVYHNAAMEKVSRWKRKKDLEIYPKGCKLPNKMGAFGENTKNTKMLRH